MAANDKKKQSAEKEKKSEQQAKLLQAKIPAEDFKKLKVYATMEDKTLAEVQDDVIANFFEEREEYLEKGGVKEKLYNASPNGAENANFILAPTKFKKVMDTAKKDNTTGSRVLYTATLNYLIKKKLKKGGEDE